MCTYREVFAFADSMSSSVAVLIQYFNIILFHWKDGPDFWATTFVGTITRSNQIFKVHLLVRGFFTCLAHLFILPFKSLRQPWKYRKCYLRARCTLAPISEWCQWITNTKRLPDRFNGFLMIALRFGRLFKVDLPALVTLKSFYCSKFSRIEDLDSPQEPGISSIYWLRKCT